MNAVVTRGYLFTLGLVVTAGYFSAIVPVTETRTPRIYTVSGETRIDSIAGDSRHYRATSEDRTYRVPPSHRQSTPEN